MSAPDDGPVYELGVDVHLGERVPVREPGRPWVDEAGVRRFICPVCGLECISDPAQSEAERLIEADIELGEVPAEDERRSVCDECYPKVLAAARAEGLLG